MAKASGVPASADSVDVAPGRYFAITFDDAFTSVIDNPLPILAEENVPCTIFVPTDNLGERPRWAMEYGARDAEQVVASAEALRALPTGSVTLGAHSPTHPRLDAIPIEEADREIVGSRDELGVLLGQRIDLFAFPYGAYDERVLASCAAAGFRFAYSIGPATVDPSLTSLLRPRVAADPRDPPLVFWLKLRGAYDWMARVPRLKRLIRARQAHR